MTEILFTQDNDGQDFDDKYFDGSYGDSDVREKRYLLMTGSLEMIWARNPATKITKAARAIARALPL